MSHEPKRPLTTDQKRARIVIAVLVVAIAIIAIGITAIATTLGVPFWIAVIIAVVATGVFGVFMFLQLS